MMPIVHRGPAPPPPAPPEPLDQTVQIWMTKSQKEAVRRAAQAAGTTVSKWGRTVLLAATTK